MKRFVPVFALVLTAFAFAIPGSARGGGPSGKQAFEAKRCNFCHSVKVAAIDRAGNASSKAPDLSDVGTKHDAAWMHKFLKKRVALDGKKHPKFFIGSDKDLNAITGWLATLKSKTDGTAK